MLGFEAMAIKSDIERRDRFATTSDIALPVDFNPDNTKAIDYENDLGAPGTFP